MPCGSLHPMVWGTSVNSLAFILKTINLFLPCKLIFWKATKVGSPPNFPKLMSQLWGIPQPQYFVTSLLVPHWTHIFENITYIIKKTPKLVAKLWLPNLVLYQTANCSKPLPEPILTCHHQVQWHSSEGNFTRDITKLSLKMTYLIMLMLYSNISGTNELIAKSDWNSSMEWKQKGFLLSDSCFLWPLLLTWINFNPSMDK